VGGTGAKQDAFQNEGNAYNLSNQLQGNAASLYGFEVPQLEAQAAHPSGYTPTALASMNTAAQQSAGGSQAGAVGQGALLASRTKNAGTADAAIAKSNENAGGALSRAAVGTQVGNANLQERQQEHAQNALQGLYGTDLSGSENALGLSNNAINIAGNQKPGYWQGLGQQLGSTAANAALFGVAGA
jgi:hypothetical protein